MDEQRRGGDGARIEDAASGLFSEDFLNAVLPTRIATARRSLKQLGLVLARVVPAPGGHGSDEADAPAVGALVHATLRDSDIACRLDDGRWAMLLEFTPLDGCMIVAERFARRVRQDFPGSDAVVGMACYPAHALDHAELLGAASRALADATTPGTIVVAPVAD